MKTEAEAENRASASPFPEQFIFAGHVVTTEEISGHIASLVRNSIPKDYWATGLGAVAMSHP
ncbi:hypothetical protein DTW90_33085 [Neorhizobium sp. P12A]|nr:hypothetical protein DTW90_33085 [Neorhizobium sp. P12A]